MHSTVSIAKDVLSRSIPASWSGVCGNVYLSQQSKLLHVTITSRPLSQILLLLFRSSEYFFFLPLSELTDKEKPLPATAVAPEPELFTRYRRIKESPLQVLFLPSVV